MATLYKIKGSPFWYLNYIDENGNRVRKATEFTKKKYAQQELGKILEKIEKIKAGIITASPTLSIHDFFNRYTKIIKLRKSSVTSER